MNTVIFCLIALIAVIPSAESAAFCTYHNYNAGDSLTTVACSDGKNGVMTKFGYNNLSPMFPYVTAFSGATWNSPNCGRCVQVTNRAKGNSVFLTVIDQCGPPPGGFDAHFDIAPPAFRELFGDAGVNAGVQHGDWAFVGTHMCKGNKGGNPTPNPVPVTNPVPVPNPPSGCGCSAGSVRCGASWTAANTRCGNTCSNNGHCQSGETCFKDLNSCPKAIGDDDPFTEAFEEAQFNAAVVEEELNNEIVEGDYYDAAVGDTNAEETVEAIEYYDADAALGDNAFVYDAAVTDETQTASQAQSNGTPGWAVALVVLASVVLLALIAVVVQLARMLRQ